MCYITSMMRNKGRTDYTIKAVVRTLKVLEEFVVSEEREIGVSEIARRVGLQKNNVFRILSTLQLYGYVEQNKDTENYKLGSKCLLLGDAYLRKIDPLREKQSALESLSKKCRESAYLCMKNGNSIYHLLSSSSSEVISVNVEKWKPLPVDKHVAGRLIEKLEKDLGKGELDFEPLIDRENTFQDVISIAFPVVEINHLSAIVVYIPSFRGDEERVKYVTNVGMEIVNELNRKLGERSKE